MAAARTTQVAPRLSAFLMRVGFKRVRHPGGSMPSLAPLDDAAADALAELSELVERLERAEARLREQDGLMKAWRDRNEQQIAWGESLNARRLLAETYRLDTALAVVEASAQKVADHPDGDEWVGSYYLKCGPWHRVLGLRQRILALAGAVEQGNPTVPCPTCEAWCAVPMEDVPQEADAKTRGRVPMRCPNEHEWQLAVIGLPEDLRGEKALEALPRLATLPEQEPS